MRHANLDHIHRLDQRIDRFHVPSHRAVRQDDRETTGDLAHRLAHFYATTFAKPSRQIDRVQILVTLGVDRQAINDVFTQDAFDQLDFNLWVIGFH